MAFRKDVSVKEIRMADKTTSARLTVVVLLMVTFLPAMAQESAVKGSLGGLAVDSRGAAVPGAIVTILGATGAKTDKTDRAGKFMFGRLIPGFYSVKVEKQGFTTATVKAVEVLVGKTQVIRVTLDANVERIRLSDGAIAFEYVGKANDSGAISSQFGYFSYVAGLPAFKDTLEDAAHANFTFLTGALTQRVTTNGTLRILDRTGTTTLYLATSPASFSDPNSFRSGFPVQVSTMTQQVIIDTTTGDFSAVNVNTVTQTTSFMLAGKQYQLGNVGDQFRTVLRGKTDAAALQAFFVAGYAVGTERH